MNLIYFGLELNSKKEVEIFNIQAKANNGFIVFVTKTDNTTEVLFNVTEVHNEYKKGKIAFESDIHSGGITYFKKYVKSVVILADHKIHNTQSV